MRGILELTVVSGDLEFLKYIVSNHSVDVNGELLKHACILLVS